MSRRALSLMAVTGLAGLSLLGGCTLRDAICGSDAYPVKAVDSTTGATCVDKGQEPPAGYVRYPDGKTPKHVGDEWDRYWDEHRLDGSGNEIP